MTISKLPDKTQLNQAFVDALRMCLGKDPLYKQLDEHGGFALHPDWSIGAELWDLQLPEDLRENGNGAQPRVPRKPRNGVDVELRRDL